MDSKMRELLQTALAKTERGRLTWSAFGAESFRAAIGSGYLHIHRAWTPPGSEGNEGDVSVEKYFVQVSDGQGRVVVEEEAREDGRHDDFPLFRDLFKSARRAALGGYKVIDDMLGVLKQDA